MVTQAIDFIVIHHPHQTDATIRQRLRFLMSCHSILDSWFFMGFTWNTITFRRWFRVCYIGIFSIGSLFYSGSQRDKIRQIQKDSITSFYSLLLLLLLIFFDEPIESSRLIEFILIITGWGGSNSKAPQNRTNDSF